jgi:hypothetical protein
MVWQFYITSKTSVFVSSPSVLAIGYIAIETTATRTRLSTEASAYGLSTVLTHTTRGTLIVIVERLPVGSRILGGLVVVSKRI